jgi:hypothetical protein
MLESSLRMFIANRILRFEAFLSLIIYYVTTY